MNFLIAHFASLVAAPGDVHPTYPGWTPSGPEAISNFWVYGGDVLKSIKGQVKIDS
jgi:hypothetical protein